MNSTPSPGRGSVGLPMASCSRLNFEKVPVFVMAWPEESTKVQSTIRM
ncbi:MAG TPA: hypothetical protein VF669_00580 [Tepidisphaeraceae bacterium]